MHYALAAVTGHVVKLSQSASSAQLCSCQPPMGLRGLVAEQAKDVYLGTAGPPDRVLHETTMHLQAIRVDGQDAEAGLFSPVPCHPSSIQGHQGSKSLPPKGDRFPLCTV